MGQPKRKVSGAMAAASKKQDEGVAGDATARGNAYTQVMDQVDHARAVRLRTEYGRVKWLVSWYEQEDGFWLVRLSCPNYDETVEALGQSRCLAIDSATRHLLDLLHRQSAEKRD